ncbi:hypothetical protein U9M48_029382, partial [Paspalum notatum var. saurae]
SSTQFISKSTRTDSRSPPCIGDNTAPSTPTATAADRSGGQPDARRPLRRADAAAGRCAAPRPATNGSGCWPLRAPATAPGRRSDRASPATPRRHLRPADPGPVHFNPSAPNRFPPAQAHNTAASTPSAIAADGSGGQPLRAPATASARACRHLRRADGAVTGRFVCTGEASPRPAPSRSGGQPLRAPATAPGQRASGQEVRPRRRGDVSLAQSIGPATLPGADSRSTRPVALAAARCISDYDQG